MCKSYRCFTHFLEKTKWLPFFLNRTLVGSIFALLGYVKLTRIEEVARMFEAIGIPLHFMSANLVGISELVCGLFLILGFLTRLSTIPLITILVVAISKVHLQNGLFAMNQGIEIPVYYLIMLLIPLFAGPGAFSIDALLTRKWSKK